MPISASTSVADWQPKLPLPDELLARRLWVRSADLLGLPHELALPVSPGG